jgi:hypothetical protein
MAVRKICRSKGCRASPRCEHPWWFDVMHKGKRWRMAVDEFAIPRGATEPVTSKQAAEMRWQPLFIADIVAGRDPKQPPNGAKAGVGLTVAEFLDIYMTNYIEAEGKRDPVTIRGRLKAVKETLGHLPVSVLEKPAEILRFKAAYRKGREIATVNRALSTLRAAVNWGRFQDPPYLATSPFHRFGVTIKIKDETKRDRRVGLQEEQALLAACSQMNGGEHKHVGPLLHDRLIGALETCCRKGEMLRIQNRHVDWEHHQIAIPGRHAKDSENRRVTLRSTRTPRANPQAPCVTRPKRVRVRLARRRVRRGLQDSVGIPAAARERPRHHARETRCPRRSRQATANRPALARPPSRRRLPVPGRRSGHPHDPADARPRRHQADAAVSEHH